MKRFISILAVCASIGVGGCGVYGDDVPAIHGMLLFGAHTNEHGECLAYISHLPMFHQPHNYQLVAEVQLHVAGNFQNAWQKKNGIYTLVPGSRFTIPDLVADKVDQADLWCNIYQGHFERGGTVLFPAFLDIQRVIYFEKLPYNPPAMKPALEQGFFFNTSRVDLNLFIVLGDPDHTQYVLRKIIGGPPAVDEIHIRGSSDEWILYKETEDLSH